MIVNLKERDPQRSKVRSGGIVLKVVGGRHYTRYGPKPKHIFSVL